MEYVIALLSLLGGLGAFLMGVTALSDNTEKLANSKIKNLFNKTSKSKLVGVGIGAVTTAIVQSSGVTTVMIVGLVNAGIMSLFQATTMIMGANIGTTITAQLASLQQFDFMVVALPLTFVGALINMISKNDRRKTVGYMLAGLGLIFVGLDFMSSSTAIFKDSEEVKALFETIKNPFLLLLIGFALTALTQSSSVVTSILIVFAGSGLIVGGGGNSVLFVILGTNIGSCVTALISSIGASKNARRASLIHLLFNTFGSIIFFIFFVCWPDFMNVTFARWFPAAETQIAMFHTAFNVVCTLMFLPFTALFVKLSEWIIRDKKEPTAPAADSFLDERMLNTPGIALDATGKAMLHLLDMSYVSLDEAFAGFKAKDVSVTDSVVKNNAEIANFAKRMTDFLIKVSSQNIGMNEEKLISAMHNNVGDIVRISELAENITKYTNRVIKDGLEFSPYVNSKLDEMVEKLHGIKEMTKSFVVDGRYALIGDIDATEDEIDNMRRSLLKDHVARLNNGECRPESSSVFINLVCNLERVGDHVNYIAHTYTEL
ncbi:MAG: Na/Pi cotransporter family protein [Bacillota bacterium]|nr:MAG: Na/Pi cotransporter family protein [Bacillota bacterium]